MAKTLRAIKCSAFTTGTDMSSRTNNGLASDRIGIGRFCFHVNEINPSKFCQGVQVIGIPCRTIDRLVSKGFQISGYPALISSPDNEVYVLGCPQIAITRQGEGPCQSMIDFRLFEETCQTSEYGLNVHALPFRLFAL